METTSPRPAPLLEVDYRWITRPQVVAGAIFSMVAIYLIYTVANPAHEVWNPNVRIDWLNVLRFLFVEVYLIEMATGAILFWLICLYGKALKLNEVRLDLKGVLSYQAKFFPLFLTAFFLINPVTQSIRYWYEHFPEWHSDIYFSEYFYSVRLYLVYLIPILLMGYGVLNINLAMLYSRSQQASETREARTIKVADVQGEAFIPLDSVMWFAVEDRKYFAATPESKMRIAQPLDKLEETLDGNLFFRVNRAVIVNLRFVKSYAYWENDKYVLHMNDAAGTTFTLTRKRMKELKEVWGKGSR